jgi:C4-dicarboxylate-specific signal transduction histidine kinase
METNSEGKNEKTFKNFGRKVDDFVAELNEASDRLRVEFKQKYDDLRSAGEKLKKESETNERWKEVEESLRKAGDELANAFKAAFKKRDPQDPPMP